MNDDKTVLKHWHCWICLFTKNFFSG